MSKRARGVNIRVHNIAFWSNFAFQVDLSIFGPRPATKFQSDGSYRSPLPLCELFAQGFIHGRDILSVGSIVRSSLRFLFMAVIFVRGLNCLYKFRCFFYSWLRFSFVESIVWPSLWFLSTAAIVCSSFEIFIPGCDVYSMGSTLWILSVGAQSCYFYSWLQIFIQELDLLLKSVGFLSIAAIVCSSLRFLSAAAIVCSSF